MKQTFNVCITSYNTIRRHACHFKSIKWKYLVVDQAHNIKNFRSKRWETMLTLDIEHRLMLTGTPLQNNLTELWSLVHFLMPHVFQTQIEFEEWFDDSMVQRKQSDAITTKPKTSETSV